MNEEELFCKLFPEYVVNGKPLSPYFDLFESGYEQSEKRIEELEKENAELKSLKDVADLIRLNNSHIVAMAQLNNNNVALRKENAELKLKLEVLEGQTPWKDIKDKSELIGKLTKAKDIIKGLLSFVDSLGNYSGGIFAKAEQFLNCSEKPNN